MSSMTVGLTGGLASGKSTVGQWLGEAGFEVVDADEVVAESYRPGGAGARRVEAVFGVEALTPAGAVDRAHVAEIVFADDDLRERLEEAIHPLVREHFLEVAKETRGVAVLEATLLVEANLAEELDLIVTVEADEEVRVQRAVARGLSEDDARARIDAQGSDTLRRSAAEIVIDNNGDLDDLRKRTKRLIKEVEERAATGGRWLTL